MKKKKMGGMKMEMMGKNDENDVRWRHEENGINENRYENNDARKETWNDEDDERHDEIKNVRNFLILFFLNIFC